MYQLHRFDTNKEKDTQQSFTSFCPDWKTVPLHKAWQKYAKKCYGGGAVPFQFYNDFLTCIFQIPYQVMYRLF